MTMSPTALKWVTTLQGSGAAYRSLHPYNPQGPGEVDLGNSEVVRVLEKFDEHGDGEWWKIQRSDGVEGMVPSNFLEKVPDYADATYYTGPPRATKSTEGDTKAGESRKTSTVSTGAKEAHAASGMARSASAGSDGEEDAGDGEMAIVKDLDPRVDKPEPFLQIVVDNPRKSGTFKKVVTWVVTTQTNLNTFRNKGLSIRRKYEDFVWLHDYLESAMPDRIVPPLADAASSMSKMTGGMDEHFIFKRTVTSQIFLNRLAANKNFRDHPMFRLMLEGTSNDLRRAKKHKGDKKEVFKHPGGSHKPQRDGRMLKVQTYYENLSKHLKDLKTKSENHLKKVKDVAASSNHYYSSWQAIANNEPVDTYTKRTMGVMAGELKALENLSTTQVGDMEKLYRQHLKDLGQYVKEALAYIQRVFDLEDTVAYWTIENQSKRESLSHKSTTLGVVASNSKAPPKKAKIKGQDAATAAAMAAKIEKKEKKDYKKQQTQKKELSKDVKDLEKKVAETYGSMDEAKKRLEATKAVVWEELMNFDLLKETELQAIHIAWMESQVVVYNQAFQKYSKLTAEVRKPISPNARAIAIK